MVNDGAFVGNSTDVVEVKNNYIKTTGATGIFARGSNVKLVGNNIEDAGTEGIWADGSAGSDAPNCMIADNTVLNSGSYGIFLNAATQYCKIDNNIVKASQSSGIGVFNTPDVTVTNNTCMNNNQAASATIRNASGIALYEGTDPCDNCVITGNRCGDDQGVKTQLYGVSETGSSTGFVVVGNNLFGNATAAFSGNAGDGTVASNFP